MITEILSDEVQEFITSNLDNNLKKLALSKNPFPTIDFKEILNQIVSKKKAKEKLATWFTTSSIYYPNYISIEQTSSEVTAALKSNFIFGENIIDLTGGFGVDCFYFAKNFKEVVHCEYNSELSEIVKHNFKTLKVNNVIFFDGDGLDYLKNISHTFDWIYLDPARRDTNKSKVFLLDQCQPNVIENLDFYFTKTNRVLIKTSPMLDIQKGINELKYVKEIKIIAVHNEVKELLWFLEKDYLSQIKISSYNLESDNKPFEFVLGEQKNSSFSLPKKYLYEPNVAILKSGGVDYLSNIVSVTKLHPNSHLFTSDEMIADFPGRIFEIEHIINLNKENQSKFLKNKKMNVAIRNFPMTVEAIKKKFKIIDGGNWYVFFTTLKNEEKIALICKKNQK